MTIHTLKENSFYKTADLALAAAIFLFHPIESVNKQNPRKAEFQFVKSQKLDKLIESYWKGELKVEPQAYFNALRVIKARLYDKS